MLRPGRTLIVFLACLLLSASCGQLPKAAKLSASAAASASGTWVSGSGDIPLSDAANETARAAVGGTLNRIPASGVRAVSVTDFGANGADRSSDTQAIQNALNSLSTGGGTVYFPAGSYYCAGIKVPSGVSLVSVTPYGFSTAGMTVLIRNDPNADCVLNLTGAKNVTVSGISLEGMKASSQKTTHGIQVENAENIDISRGVISAFSGAAVYIKNSKSVTVRSGMLCGSSYGVQAASGSGLLIYDNWLTSNFPAGYAAGAGVSDVLVIANRIEWNGTGTLLENAGGHKINGNYFDRCNIGGLRITGGKDIQIVGNVNQRNGVLHGTDESCNVYLNGVTNLIYSGNVMEAIKGDGSDQNVTPEIAMILKGLKNSKVVFNTAYKGYTDRLLKDYGGHSSTQIADNVGQKR